MAILAVNRKAKFDYEFIEKYEAGLVLFGHEVKSVKTGHISLKGAFVTIHNNELFLTNALIPLYEHAGNVKKYDPNRSRKLLVKRSEIRSLIGKKAQAGLTMVPIRVYTKRNLIKLEFALARGKAKHDKRNTIKKRDIDRNIARALKY
ncbi:MAG: SsrA-binding protein SmpB [Patescibacteria group bacterium]|nr:SsrA-binding protein SmpB [Patescibacteria group bacterium]